MSGPDFGDQTIGNRRLTILRLLAEVDGSSNTSSLEIGLQARGFTGRALPFGCVEEDCAFMARLGFVYTDEIAGDFGTVTTVRLGKLGVAYLHRRIPEVEGVRYPSLGI